VTQDPLAGGDQLPLRVGKGRVLDRLQTPPGGVQRGRKEQVLQYGAAYSDAPRTGILVPQGRASSLWIVTIHEPAGVTVTGEASAFIESKAAAARI
jgi:hypothetical protein